MLTIGLVGEKWGAMCVWLFVGLLGFGVYVNDLA